MEIQERDKKLDDTQRHLVREHPRSRQIREELQARANARNRIKSKRFDTPEYKLNYTSKATDKAGDRWHRYAVKGEPFKHVVQLIIRVRWNLRDNRGYIETTGASSSWVYTRQNYKYMLDEAFSSAVKKTKVTYGMISSYKIISERLMRWTRSLID